MKSASGRCVILHAKVVTVARELSFCESLGEEISRIEFGADVANADGEIPDVVSDLEVTRVEMFCALTGLRIVHGELDRFVVNSNRSRCNAGPPNDRFPESSAAESSWLLRSARSSALPTTAHTSTT